MIKKAKSIKDIVININADIKAPDPVDFPLHIFPERIYNFITDVNSNAGFSKDFLSVSVMSAFASVIGKGASLKINGTWSTTPIFWFAVVGEPGSKKSHPVKFALNPLKKIDIGNYKIYKEQMEQYEIFEDMEDKEKKNYIANNGKIRKPNYKQIVVRDATIESLFHVHDINSKGILLYRDELIGWLRSMGQYKQGKGDEMEKWLSMFDGDELKINRVSKEPLVMENTSVNLIGTIQPNVLNEIKKDNGLLQRFLFTNNENKIKRFIPKPINEELINDYLNDIFQLNKYFEKNENHEEFEMDSSGMKEFIKIDDYLCKIQEDDNTEPILIQYCEKLKTYIPRFALLIYILNTMYQDEPYDYINKKIMELTFDTVKYFLNTAKIMFLEARESDEAKEAKSILNGKSIPEKVLSMLAKKIKVGVIAKELGISRQYIYKIKKSVN